MSDKLICSKKRGLSLGVRLVGLALMFAAVSASAQSVAPGFVPQPRDPGPDVKREVILRLERYRTCDNCPAYEIRFLEDGTFMFWGKEAVRLLGVYGTYMNRPLRYPLLANRYVLETWNKMIEEIWPLLEHHAEKMGNLKIDLANDKNDSRWETRVVEIGAIKSGRKIAIRFREENYPALADAAKRVEALYTATGRAPTAYAPTAYDVVPRPPVFADAGVVVHWRSFSRASDECKTGLLDWNRLIVTLYADGRLVAEGTRALWELKPRPEELPRAETRVPNELVEDFQRRLLNERGGPGSAVWTPASQYPFPRDAHEPSLVDLARDTAVFVRDLDGTMRDLTVPPWDIRLRKARPWSPATQKVADRIAAMAWEVLPKSDMSQIEKCRASSPLR